VEATNRLIDAYAILRNTHPKAQRVEPVPEVKQEHPAPEGETKKPWEPKPVPESEVPPELPTNSAEGGPYEYFKEAFDRFVIQPQPDEKASVEFYRTGMGFPVGAKINKWKNVTVANALLPLGEFDPSKAQEIHKSGVMYWRKGGEFTISQGKYAGQKTHYKDLCLIQAVL
jgi:hypothetical protein